LKDDRDRSRFRWVLFVAVVAVETAAFASGDVPAPAVATYRVRLLGVSPPRFSVQADLPMKGSGLVMAASYPAELPQMAGKGWPALISSLKAFDAAGTPIALESAGAKGWTLSQPHEGRIALSYDVDFSIFAEKNWSSPLESAFADAKHVVVSGRGLFVTCGEVASAEVDFDVQRPWRPVMPWNARSSSGHRYAVRSAADLTDNMLVFSTVAPDVVKAAGFTLQITAMGHWEPLRASLRRVLGAVIAREVKLMRYTERETYNVVLVPIADTGGEGYRQSLAYCFDGPTEDNRAQWANTLAHEIFHYWNYARLLGTDYASTQWFQEGFTEYVANTTLVAGSIVEPDVFIAKLGKHVRNYRQLETTLEAIGSHKGAPLYSAGALVAFSWDVMIREASGGRRNLGDFFRNLWRQTMGGARTYAWADLAAALGATADADWEGFHRAYIEGHDPLPLERVLPMAGLRLNKDGAGQEIVELDPEAPAQAKALWLDVIGGR